MRNTFINKLLLLADEDPRVFLVVGDLGYSVIEPFAEKHPDRFLNAGVAEQNMAGVAAGLAMSGYKVFTYSIANFPTLRCLEQIRNDICYHGLDVTIVSIGGGLGYGSLGYSHHAVQDLACLRTMPGMTLLMPGCPYEVEAVTEWKVKHPGPAYLRLGKGGDPNYGDYPTQINEDVRLVKMGSDDIAFLAIGGALGWAGPIIEKEGGTIYSLPICNDNSKESLVKLVSSYKKVIVCEEHLRAGGMGSFVRETLESWPDLQSRLKCLALDDEVCGKVGDAGFLRHNSGLSNEHVKDSLKSHH